MKVEAIAAELRDGLSGIIAADFADIRDMTAKIVARSVELATEADVEKLAAIKAELQAIKEVARSRVSKKKKDVFDRVVGVAIGIIVGVLK